MNRLKVRNPARIIMCVAVLVAILFPYSTRVLADDPPSPPAAEDESTQQDNGFPRVEDFEALAASQVSSSAVGVWVARYNGPANGDDQASAMAVDGSGKSYVTGPSAGIGTRLDYATVKYDVNGNRVWVARYNGPGNNDDLSSSVAVDGSGNVYVTGFSMGSGVTGDYATIKYDSNGNQLWVARYDGPGNGDDNALALAVDGFGNVYVTGFSKGIGTNSDYATVKYDSGGNQVWVARYNDSGNGDDYPAALALGVSGDIWVAGQSRGTGTGDDYATVKYDPGGNQVWVARYNGPGNGTDYATGVKVDVSGNAYVTGASDGTGTDKDYATVKYDSNGTEEWVARYNGVGNGYDGALAIAIDDSGNGYVTGWSTSGVDRNGWVTIKYDSSGNQLWLARYDGQTYNQAHALAVDGLGNVYVAGESKAGSDTSDYDYVFLKYDSAGKGLWGARYNGPGNRDDLPIALALDGLGSVYVTGWSTGAGSGADLATIRCPESGIPQPIKVISPDGGENWAAGSTHNITWTSSGVTGNVKVELSRDSGATWTSIVPTTPNSGIKAWTVTGPGTVHARVRISSVGSPAINDNSDSDFTITSPRITLTAPNGGEGWVVGSTQDITWSSIGVAGTVDIDLSRNGGTTWDRIASSVNVSDGNLAWTVTPLVTTHARLRVSNAMASATSASDFTIRFPDHWVSRYNGPGNRDDWATAMTLDATGNVYVTGPSDGGTGNDYATMKYDTNGSQLWVARYSGPGSDYPTAIAVDVSGNVYVTGGSFVSGVTQDCVTVKYDASGSQMWVAKYDGPGHGDDAGLALSADGSGNVFVTGSSKGSGTGYDYATIKYDSSGGQIWVSRYDGPGNADDGASALALDSTGNVFVTGGSKGSGTGYDYATVKYNSIGTEEWVSRYNGPRNGGDYAVKLALDTSGNVYVTGGSDGVSTDQDYATVKYDTGGHEVWVSRYNGPASSYDYAVDIAVDGSANVYVTGYSASGGDGTGWATVKYDTDGHHNWATRFEVQTYNVACALALDSFGNVYVAGDSKSSASSNYDYIVIKYGSDGSKLWGIRYNGPGNGDDVPVAIAVDSLGGVYTFGSSVGSGPGTDFATVKYIQPSVNLISPNGGETWTAGSSQRIIWNSVSGVGNVKIELSRDGGTTWNSIIPSTANLGAADWTLTGPGTSKARIRVSAATDPTVADSSVADFAIMGPPSIVTGMANPLGSTTATLNGNLTGLGSATTVSVSFLWGLSPTALTNETVSKSMGENGAFSADISGLTPNTTYYFKAKAVGDGTTLTSTAASFKYMAQPPSLTSDPATSVSRTGATLNGKISTFGTASSASVSFVWGTSPAAMTNETTSVSIGIAGAFSADLTALTPGTTYYFKAKATGDMTAYGTVMNFKFLAKAPVVSSKSATGNTRTTATLNGNLTDMGSANPVTVSFVWGTSPTALTNETAQVSVGTTGAFSADLSSLTPGTTYYYKAKAVGDGTVYGVSTTFKFLAKAPVVSSKPATGITRTAATLNGVVTGLGTANPVTVSFVWGTSPTALTNATSPVSVGITGAFSADLTGLTPGTTYYFKAKAVGDGTVYGVSTTFKFLAKAPAVLSKPATGITRTAATLNGNLTGLGSANPVTVSFVWGTSPKALTNETAPVSVGTTGAFSANLTGLTPGTTYYFKAKAVGDGTVYGVSTTFKFLAKAPVVSSKPATGITRTAATLNGNLTGLGTANPVTVSFVWGTSPTALTTETASVSVGTTGAFSANLTGLTSGTTYYFKAKAVGDGNVYGAIITVKTLR